MSPLSRGAAMSAAFVMGVFLVSILPAGDWASVPTAARHYFLLISLLQVGTRILYIWLP